MEIYGKRPTMSSFISYKLQSSACFLNNQKEEVKVRKGSIWQLMRSIAVDCRVILHCVGLLFEMLHIMFFLNQNIYVIEVCGHILIVTQGPIVFGPMQEGNIVNHLHVAVVYFQKWIRSSDR